MKPRILELHNRISKSVKEYAYFEDKNYPIRKYMEDNHIAIDEFGENSCGLFAILDGHGGSKVSSFCVTCLPNEEYTKNKYDIKGAFQRTMVRTDDKLRQQILQASDTGSTCCLVFVQNYGESKRIHVANLGDTRAVLCSDGKAKRITVDHKTANMEEVERVQQQGGVIMKGRVSGQLGITRALGDLELKQEGVINIPSIQSFVVTNSTKFLIIASDGLWDVCEDQQAIDLVKNMPTTKDMARTLGKFAVSNGSQDNISVLVLKFK